MNRKPLDSNSPDFDRYYMQGHPDAHLVNDRCIVDGCVLADGHEGTHRSSKSSYDETGSEAVQAEYTKRSPEPTVTDEDGTYI